MNSHHLPYVLRQYIEHKHPGNLYLHVWINSIGWLALATLASQVSTSIEIPLLGANLGAWFAILSALYWLPVDPLLAGGALVWTALWALLPLAPWGPMSQGGHGWLGGVVAPLLTFTTTGLTALFAHVYYHEHCEFMKDEPRAKTVVETFHAVIWGIFHFWLEYLLSRGYRPALKTALDAAERQAILRRRGVPWQSWGETASAEPAVVCVPQSAADVQVAVKEAHGARRKVRVVGSGFTWPGFSATSDYLLFVERLDSVDVDLSDPTQPAAWVGAGATNRQINAVLARHQLTVPYNVVLETVRMAGVVSVGTHGSGRATATMSDLVLALEVVDSAGNLQILSQETVGEEGMRAARMGFGLFGVITRVRIAVVRQFAVLQTDSLCDEGDVLAKLAELVNRHDSVELYWLPYTDKVWLRTLDRSDRRPERLGLGFLTSNFLQMLLFIGLIRKLVPRWPGVAVPMLRAGIHFLSFRPRVLLQAEAQHYRRWVELVKCRCVEVAFKVDEDLGAAQQAWLETRRLTQQQQHKRIFPLNVAVNMRFVGPSDALLSPAFGPGLTCYIEALAVQGTPAWPEFSSQLAQAWLQQPGALPHWAKEFDAIPGIAELTAERLGERLTRFRSALQAAGVDPAGQFANPLTQKLRFAGPS